MHNTPRDMAFGTLISRHKYNPNKKTTLLVNALKDAGVLDRYYDDYYTHAVNTRTEAIKNLLLPEINNANLNVLHIGCGFSTYYDDLNLETTQLKWTNVDLKSVIMLRYTTWDESFDDTNNVSLMIQDLSTKEGLDYLKQMVSKTDVLLAEGILMYLPKEQAKEILALPWKTVIFDVIGNNRSYPLGKTQLWKYKENEWNLNIKEKIHFDSKEKDSILYMVKNG